MPTIFDKLQLKSAKEILVLDAPPGFESELAKLAGVTVLRSPSKAKVVRFALSRKGKARAQST